MAQKKTLLWERKGIGISFFHSSFPSFHSGFKGKNTDAFIRICKITWAFLSSFRMISTKLLYIYKVSFRLRQHILLISLHGIFFVDFSCLITVYKCKYAQFQSCRIIAIHHRNIPPDKFWLKCYLIWLNICQVQLGRKQHRLELGWMKFTLWWEEILGLAFQKMVFEHLMIWVL